MRKAGRASVIRRRSQAAFKPRGARAWNGSQLRIQLGRLRALARLPEGIVERIDTIAGKNRRAEFIREAVEAELKRRERKAKEAARDGA